MVTRRRLLQTAGVLGTTALLAGCSGSSEDEEESGADTIPSPTASPSPTESPPIQVDVGPEKRLRYEPEEVEISVGDTVVWIARSVGHNVTSHPEASPKCENPEGVEPFTSYEGDDHFAIIADDRRKTHDFSPVSYPQVTG